MLCIRKLEPKNSSAPGFQHGRIEAIEGFQVSLYYARKFLEYLANSSLALACFTTFFCEYI